ncbi:MAG: Spy/CpxP family protein refolding chaperone [Bacillota bacterium]
MKKVLSLVLIFSLLLIGISSTTFAFGNLSGQNDECVMEEELDLTEKQIEELTQKRNDFEETRNDIQEQIRDYNRSNDYDQADIEELRDKLQTARQEYMNNIEEILTEEQFAKVEQDPKINMYQGSQAKNGNNQNQTNGKGNGQGQGNSRANGKGKGNA